MILRVKRMLFQMHLSGVAKPAFAIAAAHGLTDIDSIAWVPPYVTMALLPIPTKSVTLLFCAASIFHFSEDSNIFISLALHTFVLITGLLLNVQTAFMFMLGYLTLVHVPCHYARCVSIGRSRPVKYVCFISILAATACIFSPQLDISFGDEMQRLVIAHVVVEAYISLVAARRGLSSTNNA